MTDDPRARAARAWTQLDQVLAEIRGYLNALDPATRSAWLAEHPRTRDLLLERCPSEFVDPRH